MSKDFTQVETSSLQDTLANLPKSPLNRRQLLRMMAVGSATVVGGAIVSACGGTTSSTPKITLYVPGWPVGVADPKNKQTPGSWSKAYADMLNGWLSKPENQGVTLKASTANIWDPQALTASIVSNTAPAVYPAVFGTDDGTRAAFARGLAQDVTDLLQQYHTENQLTDYAKNAWHDRWNIGGKYYGAPGDFYPGRGIFYRKDLVQKTGLPEPKLGWTWQDFRNLAKAIAQASNGKIKGAAIQGKGSPFIQTMLGTNQFDPLLTRIPAGKDASWHWKYDYTSKLDEWKQIVSIYNGMVHDDQSVLFDASYSDSEVSDAFAHQTAAMYENQGINYFSNDNNNAKLAQALGKTIPEVIGYAPRPQGTNGAYIDPGASIGITCFDPHLHRDALDAIFRLYTYYYIGEGMAKCNKYLYENASADKKNSTAAGIYNQVSPSNKLLLSYPGIPGSVDQYWTKPATDAVRVTLNIPVPPLPGQYLPIEPGLGPNDQALQDAISNLQSSPNNVDDVFKTLEQTRNSQVQSFTSQVTYDDFVAGAKRYYAAIGDFWQKNAPTFYNNEYLPWYNKVVAPSLK